MKLEDENDDKKENDIRIKPQIVNETAEKRAIMQDKRQIIEARVILKERTKTAYKNDTRCKTVDEIAQKTETRRQPCEGC